MRRRETKRTVRTAQYTTELNRERSDHGRCSGSAGGKNMAGGGGRGGGGVGGREKTRRRGGGRGPLASLQTLANRSKATMNFELTEEQRLIQDTAKRFAAEEIAPTLDA